jgi:hypothetical protein
MTIEQPSTESLRGSEKISRCRDPNAGFIAKSQTKDRPQNRPGSALKLSSSIASCFTAGPTSRTLLPSGKSSQL